MPSKLQSKEILKQRPCTLRVIERGGQAEMHQDIHQLQARGLVVTLAAEEDEEEMIPPSDRDFQLRLQLVGSTEARVSNRPASLERR